MFGTVRTSPLISELVAGNQVLAGSGGGSASKSTRQIAERIRTVA